MIKDLTGQRFGRLTVLEFDSKVKYDNYIAYYWKCRCDCGEIVYVSGCSLVRGNTRSCGCLRRETSAENGRINAIKRRRVVTYNGETHNLKEWSKIIGIKEGTIESRLRSGHSIEEAFSKTYLPTGGKKTIPREKQKKVTIGGVEYTISEAAEKFGIPYPVMYGRVTKGLPENELISQKPLDKYRNRRYNK